MRRDNFVPRIAVAYLALAFYTFGCLVLENDVNYPVWHLVGAADFGAFHQALEAKLRPFMFLPMAVQILLNAFLVRFRPAPFPRWGAPVALLLNTYVIVESFLVQVPIHHMLDQSLSVDLLQQLITTHRLYRLPAEVSAFGLNVFLMARLTRIHVVPGPHQEVDRLV